MCRRNSRSTAFFGSSRKVSEPGPAAPWTSIFKFKYSGRNCDGLKVLSWTEGVQEQLSTNCAAYAHSAAPGHSVSAAAQAGPRPVAAAGHRRAVALRVRSRPARFAEHSD